MKTLVRICTGMLLACAALVSTANATPPASAAACAACHSDDGSTRLGPSFKGLYGRKAAGGAGFMYSAAMRRADVTWDDASLDAFIADPQKAIPGTLMPFGGVADAKKRAEIIEYLKSVK
jgi:cytochrome c